jgi:hypothetical protein
MRFPQVSDRVKEAPAQALRGVFAGIGQLLLFTDKLRNKPPAHQRKPGIGAPQPAGAVPGAAGPRPDIAAAATHTAAHTAEPEPEPAAGTDMDTGTDDLPLPNYDELSVPSLRARLRTLDVAQLRQLTRYEQANAARPEVIAMYERRVAKLEAERRASEDEAAAGEAEIAARAEVENDVRAELEAEGDS